MISGWSKVPSLASCLCHTTSCAMYIVCSFYLHSLRSLKDTTPIELAFFISFLVLTIAAQLFMYITFLSRLYLAFKESVHALNQCVLRVIVLLLVLFTLTFAALITLLFFRRYHPMHYFQDDDRFALYLLVTFGVLEIIDLSLNLILVLQFLQKLFLLITDRRRTILKPSSSKTGNKTVTKMATKTMNKTVSKSGSLVRLLTPSEGNQCQIYSISRSDLSQRLSVNHLEGKQEHSSSVPSIQLLPSILDVNDMMFIDAMTKYTILSVFAIIMNKITFSSLTVWRAMDYWDENAAIRYMEIVLGVVFPLGAVLNCTVLLLHFKFSRDWYFKLCGCLHDKVQFKIAWRVDKTLRPLNLKRKHKGSVVCFHYECLCSCKICCCD